MYFIPRNNKIYNFIAHTQVKNRYLCTGFFIVLLLGMAYFLHHFVTTYKEVYLQELAMLQKMQVDGQQLETKNKKLSALIETTKQEMQAQINTENVHDYLKKQVQFVLDTIHGTGLKLHSYGVQKEKNKNWYKKERAHFELSGNLKQILDFFETIQKSQKMIAINHWSLARMDDNTFKVECDVEFVVVLSRQLIF